MMDPGTRDFILTLCVILALTMALFALMVGDIKTWNDSNLWR